MAKGKGFDFKAFLLNHSEKIGASIIGLLSLTGLATASWSQCKLDVQTLRNTADETKSTWQSPRNAWPEDKKAGFENTPDVEKLALRMASPNEDIEQFATTRHWNPPIHRPKDKLGAVTVMAPQEPEANLVMFTLAEKPDEDKEEKDAEEDLTKKDEDKKKDDTSDLADIFGANTPTPGQLAPGQDPSAALAGQMPESFPAAGAAPGTGPGSRRKMGAMGSAPGMSMPGMGTAMPGMGTSMPGMDTAMGLTGMSGMPGMPGMGEMSMEGYGGMYTGLGAQSEMKVRLCSGVSVRLVFDLREQTKLIADALHIRPQEAGRFIDFVNLQIERKRAVPGPDPWAGEWESVSLEDIGEILDQSMGTDIEIVNPQVIRSEITMPLPRRRAGKWTTANASHKRLDEFKLSEEEQEVINLHQAKMLEEANKRKALLPPEQATREGFRKYALGSQDLNYALGAEGSAMADSLYTSMNVATGSEGEGENAGEAGSTNGLQSRFKSKEDLEKFLSQTLATGRLLLVRFMDFTCDRGTSYQYRVRLEMRNPNFARPVDELEEPELATQQTVFSEWSDPTAPVYVPEAYRYYVQKVDPRNAEAIVTMYYEHETAGTPVMGSALQVPVGTRFGGRQVLEVVDLGKNQMESQDVDLKSNDFLVSVAEGFRVSASDVPALKDLLAQIPKGTKPFSDRMTVVDGNGAIVTRYFGDTVQSGEKEATEAEDRRLTGYVLETYQHLKPQEAPVGGNIYGEGGEGMSTLGSDMMGAGMDMFAGAMGQGSAVSGPGSRSGRGRSRRGGGSSSGEMGESGGGRRGDRR